MISSGNEGLSVPSIETGIEAYDTPAYPFADLVRRALGTPDLTRVHQVYKVHSQEAHDQDKPELKAIYRAFEMLLAPTYWRFIRECIYPRYSPDEVLVQGVPTFRCARPLGTAVSSFHRDSDFAHQPGTHNYWVPLTDAFETNAVYIESQPDEADYRPVPVQYGEFLFFDAVSLRHGNMPNLTGVSRLSFDLRVVPIATYRDTGATSVNTAKRLVPGDYFTRVSSSNGRPR